MACDFFGEDPTHRVYPNLVWQLKLEPWSNISQGIPAQKGLNGLKYGYDKHRDCKRNSSLSENGWPTKSLISPRVMGNSWLVSWVNHPFFIRNVTAGRFTKPNCTPPTTHSFASTSMTTTTTLRCRQQHVFEKTVGDRQKASDKVGESPRVMIQDVYLWGLIRTYNVSPPNVMFVG